MNFDDKMRLRKCQVAIILSTFIIFVALIPLALLKDDIFLLLIAFMFFCSFFSIHAEVSTLIKSSEGMDIKKRTLIEKIFLSVNLLFSCFLVYKFFLELHKFFK